MYSSFRLLTALYLFSVALPCQARSTAGFDSTELTIRDGPKSIRIRGQVDLHSDFATVHAVLRRGKDYYIVFGSSEPSRGWPPHNGQCGAGTEISICWIHVSDNGKIIERKRALYGSCNQNRYLVSLKWQGSRLLWSAEGTNRSHLDGTAGFQQVIYDWSFDPAHPEDGIKETVKAAPVRPEISPP